MSQPTGPSGQPPAAIPGYELLGERVKAMQPGQCDPLHCLGPVYYRLGNDKEALSTLREAVERHAGVGIESDGLFLAMTYHRLGKADEARRWLEKRSKAAAPRPAWVLPWQQHLELELLRREAAELLKKAQ